MQSEKNTGLTVTTQAANDQPGGSLLGHIWASVGVTIVLGVICCGIYPAAIYILGQVLFPVQADGSLIAKDGSYTTDDSKAVGSALIGQSFSLPGYFHPRPSSAGAGYDATSSGGSNLGPLSDKLINGLTTPATTQPTTQPESLAFDGVRLRTIHYATDNNIPFSFYFVNPDGTKTQLKAADIKKFQNADGSWNDCALVDAFPHPQNPTTQPVLIASDFGTLIPGDAVTGSASGLDPHISPPNARLQAARVAAARNVSVDKVTALIAQYTDGPQLGFLGDPGVNVLRLNVALDNKYPLPAAPPAPSTAPAAAAVSAVMTAVAPATQQAGAAAMSAGSGAMTAVQGAAASAVQAAAAATQPAK
jgi:K+-transporting ATPase ATPase C chain